MLYLVVQQPKQRFKNAYVTKLITIEADSKLDAVKQSKFTTLGSHNQYQVAEAFKVKVGEEIVV